MVGVEAIITGIRLEIAQTVVKLGINFNQIKTEANEAALKIGFTDVLNIDPRTCHHVA